MKEIILAAVACIGAFAIIVFIVADSYSKDHTALATCRVANPGYDCVRGYVRGEPFK